MVAAHCAAVQCLERWHTCNSPQKVV